MTGDRVSLWLSLKRYGRHDEDCPTGKYGNEWANECSCGLSDSLRLLQAAERLLDVGISTDVSEFASDVMTLVAERDLALASREIWELRAHESESFMDYRLRELLVRIRAWDHMDTAGDGTYWKREIDKVLQP